MSDQKTMEEIMADVMEIQQEAGITPRENITLVYQHKPSYWIPCLWTDCWTIQPNMECERYIGHEKGEDGFGVEWTYVPETKAPMPTPNKILFDDIADWKKYVKIPDLDAIDWKKQAEDDLRTDMLATLAKGERVFLPDGQTVADENKMGCALIINGMFERMHSMMGMENAMCALYEDPESCYEFFGAIADYKIKLFRKIKEYYPGIQVINAHDDYGFKDRMIMSVEKWRDVLKPHLKRMVDACHELGLFYQHHSCGYIEPLIPEFVEIGIDALDALQAGNTNLRAIKDEYQDRFTFVGGIDNQGVVEVPGTSVEDQIAEGIRAMSTFAPGGSYIAYPHFLDWDFLPLQIETYFRYGVPFYKENKMGAWA